MPKADSILVCRRTLNGELNGVGAYSPHVGARLGWGKTSPQAREESTRCPSRTYTNIHSPPLTQAPTNMLYYFQTQDVGYNGSALHYVAKRGQDYAMPILRRG